MTLPYEVLLGVAEPCATAPDVQFTTATEGIKHHNLYSDLALAMISENFTRHTRVYQKPCAYTMFL